MKKYILAIAVLFAFCETALAQSKVDVNKISAPATGPAISANSDSIVLSTDRGGVVPILYDASTNGKTTLIAGSGSLVIYVRGISIVNDTTSTITVTVGTGTGTNCASTYTALTPAYILQAPAGGQPTGFVLPIAPSGFWFQTAAGANLCVSTSAGVQLHIIGAADQF